MRKIKEVLRLKHGCDLSDRAIARSCDISRSTMAEYVRRAAESGIIWPLSEDLDDAKLEAALFLSALAL